jgi:TusA-related sulfurtransferase
MTRFGWADPFELFLSGLHSEPLRGGAAVPRRVEIPGRGTIAADFCLDFMGEACLRTNLVTKRALQAARPGLVIEIVSDNLSAVETIPFMLPGHDCEHLGTVQFEGGWKIYARKRSA